MLAYLDDNRCSDFYRQAVRVLRTGGKLIVTHSNKLFDFFTFNKYTVAFYEKHVGVEGVKQLIVNWNKPDRAALPNRKNSLAYRYELAHYFFDEDAQEFSIPHSRPPLLDAGFNPDDLVERKVANVQDTLTHERWKLYFTCSIFGSRSVRI